MKINEEEKIKNNVIDFFQARKSIRHNKYGKRKKLKKLINKINIWTRKKKLNNRRFVKIALLALILIVFGGGTLIGFGTDLIETIELSCNGVKTTGKVVGIIKIREGRSITYSPRIEFKTDDGYRIRFTTELSRSYVRYREGEEVQVRYNPENPKEAKIFSIDEMVEAIAQFIPLIFIFVVLPIYFMFFRGERVKFLRKSSRLRK